MYLSFVLEIYCCILSDTECILCNEIILIAPECLLFFAVQRLITWFVWLTSATILSSVNNGHKYTYPVGHIDTLRALFPFGFIYAFHFLALICPALLPRNFSFNLIFFSLLMQRQVELSSSDWHLSWHSHFNSNSYSFTYSDSNSNFSFRYLPDPPPSRASLNSHNLYLRGFYLKLWVYESSFGGPSAACYW